MPDWIKDSSKTAFVLSGFLVSVAILIGWDEMVYLIKHHPFAVLKISGIISTVVSFFMPSFRKQISDTIKSNLSFLFRKRRVIKKSAGESSVLKKRYVSPDEVQRMGIQLGHKILDSIDTFKPDRIIAYWRGGCPFGMYVQGFLEARGVHVDHIAVRTSSYVAPGSQNSTVRVHGLEYIVDTWNAGDKILMVDDVFESGRSMDAAIKRMRSKMRANMPADIRIAVAFWKPEKNKTDLIPDYVVEETDDWLVFGHEFGDLDGEEEIKSVMGEKVYQQYIGKNLTTIH
jgi:hypoxanthine phosphoribosyltransferase